MFTEQTLLHMEVRYLFDRMYPAYLIERMLDSMPGLSIITHNLACPHITVDVYLPENGCPVPHLGCTDLIKIEQPVSLLLACHFG